MISLTRTPQGLVILVISSARRSIVAASGRPNNAGKNGEEEVEAGRKNSYGYDLGSHHRGMTRSGHKAGHKQVQ